MTRDDILHFMASKPTCTIDEIVLGVSRAGYPTRNAVVKSLRRLIRAGAVQKVPGNSELYELPR